MTVNNNRSIHRLDSIQKNWDEGVKVATESAKAVAKIAQDAVNGEDAAPAEAPKATVETSQAGRERAVQNGKALELLVRTRLPVAEFGQGRLTAEQVSTLTDNLNDQESKLRDEDANISKATPQLEASIKTLNTLKENGALSSSQSALLEAKENQLTTMQALGDVLKGRIAHAQQAKRALTDHTITEGESIEIERTAQQLDQRIPGIVKDGQNADNAVIKALEKVEAEGPLSAKDGLVPATTTTGTPGADATGTTGNAGKVVEGPLKPSGEPVIVSEGDWLSRIAANAHHADGRHVTLEELRKVEGNAHLFANDARRDTGGNYIYPGDKVYLPEGATYGKAPEAVKPAVVPQTTSPVPVPPRSAVPPRSTGSTEVTPASKAVQQSPTTTTTKEGDIRGVAEAGAEVYTTAEKLRGLDIITPEQFSELTNQTINNKDFEIGRAAVEGIKLNDKRWTEVKAAELLQDLNKMPG